MVVGIALVSSAVLGRVGSMVGWGGLLGTDFVVIDVKLRIGELNFSKPSVEVSALDVVVELDSFLFVVDDAIVVEAVLEYCASGVFIVVGAGAVVVGEELLASVVSGTVGWGLVISGSVVSGAIVDGEGLLFSETVVGSVLLYSEPVVGIAVGAKASL